MILHKNQAGFSAVEFVIIFVVVGALAFAGYIVYSRQQSNRLANNTATATQSPVANDVPSAPEIKSANDLDKASATLDQVNLENNSDSSQLDSELSNF